MHVLRQISSTLAAWQPRARDDLSQAGPAVLESIARTFAEGQATSMQALGASVGEALARPGNRTGAEGKSNLKKMARNLGDAWAGKLARKTLNRVGGSNFDFLKSVAEGGDQDALIA